MQTDPFTKAMFGQHAIHIPVNIIVQDMSSQGDGNITAVLQSSAGRPLMFGGKMTHQLIMGDMVLRPHLVVESDAFRGHGLSGLARDGFVDVDKWLKGKILLDQGIRKLENEGWRRG